jgi:hypothetical protein
VPSPELRLQLNKQLVWLSTAAQLVISNIITFLFTEALWAISPSKMSEYNYARECLTPPWCKGTSNVYFSSVGAECKILKITISGEKTWARLLNTKLEIILFLESESEKGKPHGQFYILKNRGYLIHTTHKRIRVYLIHTTRKRIRVISFYGCISAKFTSRSRVATISGCDCDEHDVAYYNINGATAIMVRTFQGMLVIFITVTVNPSASGCPGKARETTTHSFWWRRQSE